MFLHPFASRATKLFCTFAATKIKRMKEAFIKLHLSVLIAGGTGVFGRLITLNEGLLVWYRMLLAGVLFYIVLFLLKKLRKLSARDALRIASVGLLLAVHWLFSMAVSRPRTYLSGWSACR